LYDTIDSPDTDDAALFLSHGKEDIRMKKLFPWASIIDWGWIPAVAHASSLMPYSGWREMSPENSLDLHPQACPWDGYGLVWESRRYAICRRQP
jgi:hypothetical protein